MKTTHQAMDRPCPLFSKSIQHRHRHRHRHDRHTLPAAPRGTSARVSQQPRRHTRQRISSNVRSFRIRADRVRSRRISIRTERTGEEQGRQGRWAKSERRVQRAAASPATRLPSRVCATTVPHAAVSERAAGAASRDGNPVRGRRAVRDERQSSTSRPRRGFRRTGIRHERSWVTRDVTDDDRITAHRAFCARWTVPASCTRDRDLSV